MATTTWQQEKNKHKSSTSDRGRNARKPKDIPAPGWKDTLVRVKEEIAEDRVSLIAAAMAFYAILSMIPALTALVLVYAWISDPSDITQQLSQVSNVLPEEVRSILESQLSSLAGQANSTLGIGAISSLIIALWSASRATATGMEALNVIYDEREERGFIKRNALALGLTLFGLILSIVAIGVIVGLPMVTNFLSLGGIFATAVTVGGWVLLIALFAFFLSMNYRFGPDRRKPQWSWVSRGSIIAAVLWVVASMGFSWYVSSFGSYNETYGSFAGVIVLMFWLYISAFIILLGGEVNAELEHQTRRDTTDEPEKPMGQRDAQMADTLGEQKDSWT